MDRRTEIYTPARPFASNSSARVASVGLSVRSLHHQLIGTYSGDQEGFAASYFRLRLAHGASDFLYNEFAIGCGLPPATCGGNLAMGHTQSKSEFQGDTFLWHSEW